MHGPDTLDQDGIYPTVRGERGVRGEGGGMRGRGGEE